MAYRPSWCTRRPATSVATARPLTFRPSNGVFFDRLVRSSARIVHASDGSITVMSAGPPSASDPSPCVSRLQSRAGSTVSDGATLVLAGVALSALFASITSFCIVVSSPDQTRGIVFWMMGGLDEATWDQVLISLTPVILGSAIIMILARDLNAMMVGEEQAGNLGINVNRTRLVLLLAASLVTAMAVSVSGVIGFVGLIIPHVVRILVGPEGGWSSAETAKARAAGGIVTRLGPNILRTETAAMAAVALVRARS